MLTEKAHIKWDSKKSDDILTQKNLKNMFISIFGKGHDYATDEMLLVKLGSYGKKHNVPLKITPIPLMDEKIHKISDVEFISDAVIASKEYRVIKDNAYKIVDFDKCNEGKYIFANNNQPLFNINLGVENSWAYKQFIISYYEKDGVFRYVPSLDTKINHIELELFVENKKKENHLLIDMFENTKNHYIDKGFEVLENLQ